MNSLTPLPLPMLPWLVQGTQDDASQLGPVWDMVKAQTSQQAALKWANENGAPFGLSFWVHVAPSAPCLLHENGRPKFCRSFQCKKVVQMSLTA